MKPDRDYYPDTYEYQSIIHMVLARSDVHDIGVTFTDHKGSDHTYSWGELVYQARCCATWLVHECGLSPNDRVGLALPNTPNFIVHLFACWMIGAIPVTLSPPGLFSARSLKRVGYICQDAQLSVLLCTAQEYEHFHTLTNKTKVFTADHHTSFPPQNIDKDALPFSTDDIGFIQYTSGSTANPKGAALSHHNINQNCHHLTAQYPFQENESFVSWLPFYHDMGLFAQLMTAAYRRLPFYLTETSTFLLNPMVWLDQISRHRCTVTEVPNFSLGYCVKRITKKQVSTLDLSCLRGIFLGSEPVDFHITESFLHHFADSGVKRAAMAGAYGMSEVTVGLARTDPMEGLQFDCIRHDRLTEGFVEHCTPSSPKATHVACMGKVIPAHHISIRTEHGERCPEETIGEIWLRGPSLMNGYWNQNENNRVLFRYVDGYRWFQSGDLGYRRDNLLFVCGRIKELIIVRGKNYHPEEIERVAEQCDDLRPGQSIAFGIAGGETEHIVLMAETAAPTSKHPKILWNVKNLVSAQLGLKIQHIVLLPPKSIPKTTSGKRQRHLAKNLFIKERSPS